MQNAALPSVIPRSPLIQRERPNHRQQHYDRRGQGPFQASLVNQREQNALVDAETDDSDEQELLESASDRGRSDDRTGQAFRREHQRGVLRGRDSRTS